MKEKSDMYQIISTLKSKVEVKLGNLKLATLKKSGFTQHLEYCGEDIDVYIPDYVDKTEQVYPDCKQICQNKARLTSHMNFKHGKFANLSCKTYGSVSPEAPTSIITKDTSIEAPTNTTITVSFPLHL